MRKNILYFLAVLIMPMLSPAQPVLSLAGVDTVGDPMRFGSGAWTESFCHPALVSDEGTVLFIAQMPDDFLDSADNRDRFRAVYQKAKAAISSEMLVEGYNPNALALGSKWWRIAWQTAASSGANTDFYLIREDFTGGTGSTLNLRNVPKDISIALPSEVTKQTLRLASGGEMVAVTADNLQKPLFYQVAGAGFSAVEIPDAAFAGYTQKSIALSPDSTMVYFTSLEDLCTADEYVDGKPGLYAYDRIQQSHQLVAFIGDSTLDSQVQCAAEAKVLVFRSTLHTSQIVTAELDPSGNYVLQSCSPGELTECADPQISADGRFVVFSAITPGSVRQIFRYDRLADKLEQITGADADAHTPAISPNGRNVALISAATNFGRNDITLPQVWLADMGPTLLDASLDIFQQQTHELPITVSGASENASITLLTGDPVPASIFFDKDGNQLSLNQEYSLDSLPWTYAAGENEGGTITVTIRIIDGDFTETAELQIHIYDKNKAILSCVSLNAGGEYVGNFHFDIRDASCSEDGSKIAFVTNLPLLTSNSYNVSHAYLRNLKNGNLKNGTLTLLSGDLDQTVTKIAISGDGNFVYFTGGGKLWKYTVATGLLPETPLISSGIDDIKPATDFSGSILAYSQNKKAVLQGSGQVIDLPCSALRLSRDGKVLAILGSANALHIWFTDAPQLVEFADNVAEFAMNQAGTEVFYLQGEKLYRQNTALGVKAEVSLPAGITATNLKNLQVSGNGRFLTWVRDFTLNEITYPGQQFLWDLNTSQELLISSAGSGLPGNGNCNPISPFPAAFSATGRKLFFTSMASNLLSADDNNTWDLFLAIWPELPADDPSVNPDILPALEDIPADLALNLLSPERNALVPLLVSGTSVQGVQLTLLGPVPGRNGYAVNYEPVQNFCGSDSFQVQLWDGAALSAPQSVNINVANVNDSPVAQSVTKNLAEGTTLTVNLQDFADDPDLNNPEPDILSFTLQAGSPDWVQINGIELVLTPDYLTVTHAESGREFAFKVLVRDNHGGEVEMPVTISVTDVNQPPTLQLTQDTIIQQEDNVTLPANIFVATDPDPEDEASLLICLQANELVTEELRSSDFPYAFTPQAAAADQLQFAVYAKDARGAISENESLTILLRNVIFQTAELWGYSQQEGKPSWESLRHGWNLLSIPFAASASEIDGIFGSNTVLWVWDTQNMRYALADELYAGQGFWIYFDDFSAINPVPQILSSGRVAPPALLPGWNLRGTDWQETELPEGWMLSPARNWEKTGSFLPGKAYWFFRQ